MARINLLIVTPEATTYEQEVDSVVVPMLDGELGVWPGHAPMIGRLGPGELRVNIGSNTQRFFVDSGFVQITGNGVSVLPGKSIPASDLDLAKAKADLHRAKQLSADKPELMELKRKAIAQAKAQIRMAEKA